MSVIDQNPRAVPGDNKAPDYARQVTETMARDYAALTQNVADMLEEARALPTEIDGEATLGLYAKLIKAFRDTTARITAFRTAEKEPYLRGGQAVDAFFFSLEDKCARRDRKNKPGAADVLQARLDDYQQRKLAEEQARRRREAEEAARVEREAREAAAKAAQEAEERRLAAERARAPAQVEAKEQAAQAAETASDAARVEQQVASAAAEEKYVDTLARPADMVRTRVDEGPLVTMQQVGYAEIEDDSKLDKNLLWPFLSIDAKEKALRAWAKTTGYRTKMDGAAIGHRNKSAVR
jgi:chemotaxis protein histidine kinase CheA